MVIRFSRRRGKLPRQKRERRRLGRITLAVERLEDRVTPATPAILPGSLFAVQTFDNDQSVTGNYHVPASPSGAAGPSHLVSVVNSSIDVIDKTTGVLLSQASLNDFFAADNPTGELFGAKVLY